VEFCGRCGKELGRGVERGRFCAACGHENPGNARYPLWDRSAGQGTRARVSDGSASATAVALPRISRRDDDATRVRMPSIPLGASPEPAAQPAPVSTWRTTLLASVATLAVILLLGFVLLFH